MIIVFDTNIWKRNLYLRAPAAAAVRFFIAYKKAKVALPEVVRLEVQRHLKKDILSYISALDSNYKNLLAVFGSLKELCLPSESDVDQKISEAFDLGINLLEVPFTLESARSSFLKTIDKTPPSAKSQQFKDGVLWADCLELLKGDDVVLVTEDNAFFEDNDPSKGLALALKKELPSEGYSFKLFSKLQDLLGEIRSDVLVDDDALEAAYMEISGVTVENILQQSSFHLGKRKEVKVEKFVTEIPGQLYLSFVLTFSCSDGSGYERGEGTLMLKGDGFYDSGSGQFSRLGELFAMLRFRDSEGNEVERKHVFARAEGIVLGHRDVTHTLRQKIS